MDELDRRYYRYIEAQLKRVGEQIEQLPEIRRSLQGAAYH